jgi:hypothetical protein
MIIIIAINKREFLKLMDIGSPFYNITDKKIVITHNSNDTSVATIEAFIVIVLSPYMVIIYK